MNIDPTTPLQAVSATDTELELIESTGAGQLYWAPLTGDPVLRIVRRTDRDGLASLADRLRRVAYERDVRRCIVDMTRVDMQQYTYTIDLKVIPERVGVDRVTHWAYVVGPATPPKLLLDSIECAQRNGAVLIARSSFADAHRWLSQIRKDPEPTCLASCVQKQQARWVYGNYSGCLYAMPDLDTLLWTASGFFNLTDLDSHVEAIAAEAIACGAKTLIVDIQHCNEVPGPVHQFMKQDVLDRLFQPGHQLSRWISVRDLDALPIEAREIDLVALAHKHDLDAARVSSLTEALALAQRPHAPPRERAR